MFYSKLRLFTSDTRAFEVKYTLNSIVSVTVSGHLEESMNHGDRGGGGGEQPGLTQSRDGEGERLRVQALTDYHHEGAIHCTSPR